MRGMITGRRRLALGAAAALMSVTLVACGSPPQHRMVSASLPASARVVVSAPVRIAHTRLGTVGYRVVGTGPPLILITGYTATMEAWDPWFVGALAEHYRVVIFDNAGVGRTQTLPAPLTVDAMANQTSALIDALGLERPDVLGWSMGGTIAQALAVLHPAQVRSLVLCATFPGTGKIMPPAQALTSGNVQQVLADLSPLTRPRPHDAQHRACHGSLPGILTRPSSIPVPGRELDLPQAGPVVRHRHSPGARGTFDAAGRRLCAAPNETTSGDRGRPPAAGSRMAGGRSISD
jgi:pimeloyl-ACP methyl ester carboxylesterase